ncbi:MAG: right-handed parallel beta-helix repeat-containing protein [Clostridia bacterium]|nr:right-handed parallel beta-helix repeat-containing protein [Clostridia bacterium]
MKAWMKHVLLGVLVVALLLSTTACSKGTPNYAHLLNPMSGGADAEAEVLRQNVLNAADELEITGTTYYVSPNGNDDNNGTSPETAWKTIDGIVINGYLLQPGDAVLFERGHVYRRTTALNLKSGVTYGAYGTGEKPALYGSLANYASSEWEKSDVSNVWTLSLPTEEAGILVFDHGVAVGTPKYDGVEELAENGDFYHDFENGIFYLFLDKGNPADVYTDIEIGTRGSILSTQKNSTDITVDNLTIKYAGLYGFISGEGSKNIRITNCEFGWAGGCRYSDSEVGLGNAISFWQDTENALVENCWIYQCYDAGITPQGVTEANTYKDLVFRGNLIEFCNYSIEFFDRTSDSKWDGLVIEDNIMRFAGYGFMPASKRPDSQIGVAHLLGWRWNYKELPGGGITIRNNIFDCSARNLVFWSGKVYDSGLTVSGNSFYQKTNDDGKAMYVSNGEQTFAKNQAELETAVRAFDPNAKVIKWLE